MQIMQSSPFFLLNCCIPKAHRAGLLGLSLTCHTFSRNFSLDIENTEVTK